LGTFLVGGKSLFAFSSKILKRLNWLVRDQFSVRLYVFSTFTNHSENKLLGKIIISKFQTFSKNKALYQHRYYKTDCNTRINAFNGE
jgi:hypothetical protein